MRNLDITTLRSLMAVADHGGVTRAAQALNLTQSAVSMQIKRLEDMLGLEVLDRSNRQVELTPNGAQLVGYARRMLRLNDEIVGRLMDDVYEGEIRLGVPHDIVYPVIPRVLKRFHATYPRVKVKLESSYTNALHAEFQQGALDLILTTEAETAPGGETLTTQMLRWIGAPGGAAARQRPLRLAYCRHCRFRAGDVERLDQAGVPWEITVESDNDRTVEASVSADLAITTMLEGHAPPHLEVIEDPDLPALDLQKINLYGGAKPKDQITGVLADMLRQGFTGI